jgi:hypothetical protein
MTFYLVYANSHLIKLLSNPCLPQNVNFNLVINFNFFCLDRKLNHRQICCKFNKKYLDSEIKLQIVILQQRIHMQSAYEYNLVV